MKTPRDLTRLTKSELYKKKRKKDTNRGQTRWKVRMFRIFLFSYIYSYHCEVYLSISAYLKKKKKKNAMQCFVG